MTKSAYYLSALTALAATFVLLVNWQVHAETNRVQFPNLDELVHYTTVRRGNVTEHIMTTPAAIEAVRNGRPIPAGTQFVLVDYRDDMKLYRYFVMEKGEGWGADYGESRRTADWQFQWFWPDKSINMDENTARCQSCHSSQKSSDFLFTGYRIPRFNGTPVD
ncbi:cytochrome P460 family protein [Mesorhizobium sp. CGMCC 1.15528]|uniref:Cytochrome P460 family protein n=1 Tax=Mesorhizobium zhangyense TaxID=1776730 RepID=A0A7C9VDH7_9HYPH|nr:cytochrome P460 family protein [Mesorhizobium zhangyense]NGN42669.1 cytochrome P460 family protein [Mesorhizobium zhangyense]